MSRIEAGVAELNLEPIDVQAFVDAVVSSAARDCRVRALIEPNVPAFVVFDKRRIGQCVANLLQNAERYGGGAAELRVSCEGDALTMTVDDEGPGVPEEERSTDGAIVGRLQHHGVFLCTVASNRTIRCVDAGPLQSKRALGVRRLWWP